MMNGSPTEVVASETCVTCPSERSTLPPMDVIQSAMAGSPWPAAVAASFVRAGAVLDASCISTSRLGRLAISSRTPEAVARL